LGFYAPDTAEHHRAAVLEMIALAFAPLAKDDVFDFADRDYAERMQAAGLSLAEDRSFSHIPPIEVLFLQRKFAGMALLCRQLGAKVNVHQVLLPHLKQSGSTG
ncbi:MAG: AarF/ABC1/UbiB kinase family protein, partial [Pseudomonadota bacterium]